MLATFEPRPDQAHPRLQTQGKNQTRAHVAAALILDGGYRISEVLGLAFDHCDFDNLVEKGRSKDNKHRLVPLSMEMRKVLYRYAVKHSNRGRPLFETRNNPQVTVRNFERDLKALGRKAGIRGILYETTSPSFLGRMIGVPGSGSRSNEPSESNRIC